MPVFAYEFLANDNFMLAGIFLLVSGITDCLDGFIARKFNMITNFGKVYDPFVDKLMQITAIVCLAIAEVIPVWIILLVMVKELAMIVTGGILYLKKIVVYSNWYGKLSTVLFYAVIVVMILWKDVISENLQFGLLIIMSGGMILAAAAYLIDTIRHYDEKRIV